MGPTRRLNAEEAAARKQKEVLEKDDTERQLEKILFGDQAGFLDSLAKNGRDDDRSLARIPGDRDGEQSENEDEDEGMEDVADEDLFFLDAGTTDLPDDVMEDLQEEHEEEQKEARRRKVLWHDSDDERISVSLANNTRLRKLRDTEDDDIVSGLEYVRRLRRQYERLHPTPEWVKHAHKRQKRSHDKGFDSDSDSDISIDSPGASVKPLAELLRSTGPLTRQAQTSDTTTSSSRILKLRPEVIDIQRQKDISSTGPSSIDQLHFHPTYPLLLTAGPSSTINLYHVSPSSQNPNPMLTSLHVKGTPITTALFSTSPAPPSAGGDNTPETKIYISARRRYFHTWSLQSGSLTKISRPLYQSRPSSLTSTTTKSKKNHELPTCEDIHISPDSAYLAIIANTGSTGGVVHLLNSTTHQPITQVRIESLNGIADVAFYRDSSGFSVVGKNGEVSEYNIAQRRVTVRWVDEGAVGTTTLALGGEIRDVKSAGTELLGNHRWVAVGSTSGIVNVYDRRTIIGHFGKISSATGGSGEMVKHEATYRPKPLRAFDHLTTPVSHLHFSSDPTGQLLVMASRWKKNALKLVHLPSCTVYRNWPTDKTPLGRISSVALSPDGRYLAVGNEAGKVRLWQIRD